MASTTCTPVIWSLSVSFQPSHNVPFRWFPATKWGAASRMRSSSSLRLRMLSTRYQKALLTFWVASLVSGWLCGDHLLKLAYPLVYRESLGRPRDGFLCHLEIPWPILFYCVELNLYDVINRSFLFNLHLCLMLFKF